jgi:glycerate kinase
VRRVLIAPQGFKGSLTGLEIAHAMEIGVKRAWPAAETLLVPVADGGDGTLQALVDASGGSIHTARVQDPLGRPIDAQWGALGDGVTAVIEMARASGLALLTTPERNPLRTSTCGVGELMLAALEAGFRKLIIGIGGSATNDGGAGMAQALGVRLLDIEGRPVGPGGAGLETLERIDMSGLDPRLVEATVDVACDVNNPLTGPDGASAVYGPQKGATPEMVRRLDAALERFGSIIRRDLEIDIADSPGAGAAGGLGAGLMAFAQASLRSGADIVLEAVHLEDHLDGADLVLVGEGRMDRSTVFDKAPVAVARRAHERGIPVLAVCGSLGEGYETVHDHGITAAFGAATGPMTLDEALADTRRLVAAATEEACRALGWSQTSE